MGAVKTVRGKIVKAGRTPKGGVLLSFHADFSKHLSILIPPHAVEQFPSSLESTYWGQEVQAKGRVVLVFSMPRLVVEDPEAIAIVEDRKGSALGPVPPSGILFRLKRGLLTGIDFCKQGKPEKGLERIERVIEISRKWTVRPFLLRGLFWKGYYLEEEGDLLSAEKSYREAVEVFEDLRGERGDALAGDKIPWVYEKLVALLVREGKSYEALDYLERSRSKALQEQFARLSIAFSDSAKTDMIKKAKRLEEALASSEKNLRKELSKRKAEQDRAALQGLQKDLSDKQRAYTSFIYELKKSHPELSALFRIDPKDLRTQRKHIPQGMVLIEYLIGEKDLYLFFVSQEDLLVKTVPIAAEALSGKIDFLLAILADPLTAHSLGPLDPRSLTPRKAGSHAGEAVSSFLEVSAELYRLLLQPLSAAFKGAEVVGIIPNGHLHSLPFEVLGETIDGTFLPVLGQWSICYLNSLDSLAGEATAESLRPVAFANADGTLPESESEVKHLKGFYPRTFVYTGTEATEIRAKTAPSKGLNAMHMAAHGRLLLSDMRRSFIQLAPDPSGMEDGRLTLEEVWGMDLDKTLLVVLSACDTAVGEQAVRGEVVSPASAFLEAGTRSIISTLWKVPDASTAALMKQFYGNLRKEMGVAKALQQAKEALASDPKTAWPFYWAPFILTGDWR
ncbi:MAG: CHAT domain-containing protein [Thermodesulfobacteriota bacterium]|nr:CHAT domain-containing protein [Thermodesulfobacteriota bacterium]